MLITINLQKRGSEYFYEVHSASGGIIERDFGPFEKLAAADKAAKATEKKLASEFPQASIVLNTFKDV
jgi:hypothetical protein